MIDKEKHAELRLQREKEIEEEMIDFAQRLEIMNPKSDYHRGYRDCRKEYEEKLRWINCYEQLPKTAELVIVDSGNDLHACVAVAFYENEEWKYSNGQKLWFRPTKWRYLL